MLWVVAHRIYEPEGPLGMEHPILVHLFFGRTPQEAMRYYEAHRTTDVFLRECQDNGRWRSVVCPAELLPPRRLK